MIMISKVLDQMIFPKIVHRGPIDLKLNTPVGDDDGWAWAQEMSDAYAQDIFLADVTPAVPAYMVFNEDWVPSMPCTTPTQRKEFRSQVVLQCHGHATSHSQRNDEQSQAMEAFMKEWKGL